ncbi:hypothetical protein [Pontibacter actiniarum]|uniref:hypothetical protein n=1 Tax=Pontibacter actiniarum TaxID=323450 RepID=UPI0012F77F35|nr:hypothetical protein [Pontibacter actiniarum]
MRTFNFKRRNLTSGPHFLGLLLLTAGVLAFVGPLFLKSESSVERTVGIGLGAILVGLVVVSSYGGTLIDFTERRFKEYLSICGYKFGAWTTLPVILTVRVISASYMSTNTPNGTSPTLSGRVTSFKTLLYSDAPKPVLSFVYSDRDKAVRHARSLANSLNADLVLNIPEGEGAY